MHCIKTNYVKFSIHCHLFLSISIYIRVVILFGFYFLILLFSSILSFHSSSFPSFFSFVPSLFFSFTIFFFISLRYPSLSPTQYKLDIRLFLFLSIIPLVYLPFYISSTTGFIYHAIYLSTRITFNLSG